MTKKKFGRLFGDLLLLLLLIAGDRYTKQLAMANLRDNGAFVIWDKVFEFHYLENRGAAFGMLQNQKLFFIFMAFIVLLVISFVLVKIPAAKKYCFMHIFLVFIAAGAVGNMIDRVSYGYVVDFIYFVLINFPIFNVADIYVTIGTVMLVLLILFYYKEEDLKFIKIKIENNNLRF